MQENMTMLKNLVAGIKWFCSARYRRYMIFRGYRLLFQRGQSDLVQKCKHQVSLVETGVTHDTASPDIFFASRPDADLVIRQFLSKRTGEKSMCISVYNAIGGGVPIHHLPPHTYSLLRELGIPVWAFGSRIRWMLGLLVYWLYGCWIFVKLGFPVADKNSETNAGSSAFFQDLPLNALPDRETPFERQDLVSWYCRWDKRNPLIRTVTHQHKNRVNTVVNGISLEYRAAGWSGYMSSSARIKYLLWGLRVGFMSLVDLLSGRWWHALLFSQAVMAKRLALSSEETLPAEIWFNHENYKYRPIWTYEAEARGVKSYLYFYSINNQTVQPAGHEISISGYWHLMNWPRCLVWNSQQKEILQQYINMETAYVQAGHMPYSDTNEELTPLSSPAIAVFDIPSYGNETSFALGQAYKYQKDHVVEAFYDDIIDAARANELVVCTKQKTGRKKSHLTARYLHLLEKLEQSPDVCATEAGIAAHRLIMATQMTVSAPYSSTSVIAEALGKPGCYYDPTGLLPEMTIFSHGIRIIRSPEALSDWMKKNRPQ
ncbi:MAG: hypothetical protein CMQ84_00560 [Gammaproteobacteria bacterium]|nr:hypothetical protein [Gammaproteobacteria bacterium]OUX81076.1 MAG: hypothetical protein CBC19_00475 [Oceanospirillales bacterium TMED59]